MSARCCIGCCICCCIGGGLLGGAFCGGACRAEGVNGCSAAGLGVLVLPLVLPPVLVPVLVPGCCGGRLNGDDFGAFVADAVICFTYGGRGIGLWLCLWKAGVLTAGGACR